MTFNPNKHHRRSIRQPGYDYTPEGWYFVTLWSMIKECIFGEIVENNMVLNKYGLIVDIEWIKTAQ